MTEPVWLLGIDMTRFGKHPDADEVDLASAAARGALSDAGMSIRDVQIIAAGNLIKAAEGLGQRMQKQIGQTGVPVFNVANACATGATALRVAIMAIRAGEADVALAVGAEKLSGAGLLAAGDAGPRQGAWTPRGRFDAVAPLDGNVGTDTMPGVFAQIGMEYAQRFGRATFEVFAQIAEKNHAHSTLNPLAAYQKRFTLEQIMNDVMIAYPNTRLMCSANCDGGAAAVLVSDAKLRALAPDQQRRAVKISASVLTSDPWQEACQVLPDVNTLTRQAAKQAYEQSGWGPEDLDLVELHDCFATAELVHYDNLGLCPPGGAVDFFKSGSTWRDGRIPVNVSGGLESKGHPISATGIANVWEIATHLRGEAGDRQIENAKVGLAHVIGLGNACGVHILERRAA
ncbi:thiolase [Mycolicibacterium setense]|uniref:thiolase family protein n=1 Tax=Mycolicibacterium setense TaxID=431269 RepID=UPI0007EA8936|nr:thiolase family protein [Mycolicibacterium setense]OBB14646.1 thiolase [Mycolicibacterium setense]